MPGIGRLLALTAICLGLLAAPSAAGAATVSNGDFEVGNLSGWQSENSSPPSGNWYAYTGTTTPLNHFPIPAPPQGSWAAITDQSGPGRHLLYQDITLPPGATHTSLTLFTYYHTVNPIVAPASLDPTVGNQQYRIDVLRQGAPLTSVAPADILLTVFKTNNGDPTTLAPTQISADLTPFAGQTVRFRFAEVDTSGNFQAGTDAVSITSNAFTLGKPKLNKKKGTATVPVTVPGPGVLSLTGKGVAMQSSTRATESVAVGGAGTVNLLVRPKGKTKRKLNSAGKAKVKVTTTYTPTGGSPNSQQKKIKLKKL